MTALHSMEISGPLGFDSGTLPPPDTRFPQRPSFLGALLADTILAAEIQPEDASQIDIPVEDAEAVPSPSPER